VQDEIDCSYGLPLENYEWVVYCPGSLYPNRETALVALRDILHRRLHNINEDICKCGAEKLDG
jgi:hypothetical protein